MLRVALLFVATFSTAQAQEVRGGVIGPLGFSCDKWVNTPKRTPDHERLRQWALGYLSGVNSHSPEGGDFLRGRDADGLTVLIDNYCRSNPLQHIVHALDGLVKVLRPAASPP